MAGRHGWRCVRRPRRRRTAGLMSPAGGTPAVAAERIGVYAAVGTSGLDCVEFLAACSAAWLTATARATTALVGGRPLRLIDPHFAATDVGQRPRGLRRDAGRCARAVHGVRAVGVRGGQRAAVRAVDDLALGRCDVAIVVACDSLLAPTPVIGPRTRRACWTAPPRRTVGGGGRAGARAPEATRRAPAGSIARRRGLQRRQRGTDAVSWPWASMRDVLDERPGAASGLVRGRGRRTRRAGEGVRALSLASRRADRPSATSATSARPPRWSGPPWPSRPAVIRGRPVMRRRRALAPGRGASRAWPRPSLAVPSSAVISAQNPIHASGVHSSTCPRRTSRVPCSSGWVPWRRRPGAPCSS